MHSERKAGQVAGHVSLKRRKRGAQFYVKYRLPDGRQVQRRLGPAWTESGRPPAGYYTRKTADAELRRMLTDAERGTLPGSAPRAGKTFDDAVSEWLRYCEHEKAIAPSTLADYRNVGRCYLLPEFGPTTPLEAIDTDRIEAFRSRLLAEGRLSRRSVQKIMVLLHGVFKRAKRRKWIVANPAEDVERVRVKRSGDFNVLSPVEVEAVARAAESEQDAAVFTVAAFTGLRMGELRALRWGDIDFAHRAVIVRGSYTHGSRGLPKSGKVRSVPLIDQAAKALDGLSRREHFTGPDDLVFCSTTGGYLDDGPLRNRFYDALKRAGSGYMRDKEDPLVFHDLRHTFGTLGAAIWPMYDLQGYMGHADIQTTMVYVHHVPKVSAAEELGRLVTGKTHSSSDTIEGRGSTEVYISSLGA